jgi:hypothetical protein
LPCNGPNCRRGQGSLPPVVPVVVFEQQDRMNSVSTVFVTGPEESSVLSRLDVHVALPMIAFRLDRPPKV